MECNPVNILLIEDSPVEVALIKAMLSKAGQGQSSSPEWELSYAVDLSTGLAMLHGHHLILLDLSLSDSNGLDTLVRVRNSELDLPVIVLTGHDDEALALEAMQLGAQDYLVKGRFDSQVLSRSIRYALKRHNILRQLALVDELTGLYNRRGLTTLGEQYVKLAQRRKQPFLVFYADMDGLKNINDRCGHQKGSQAIRAVAEILRATFRASDIIARLGGDEFAVIASDAEPSGVDALIERLNRGIVAKNAEHPSDYQLSLSIGYAASLNGEALLATLLDAADDAMYEEKRRRKQALRAQREAAPADS
jgi:two-component system cell cycle response regulator